MEPQGIELVETTRNPSRSPVIVSTEGSDTGLVSGDRHPLKAHRGVLADGWAVYFRRAFAHFFWGEPGERCVFLYICLI